MKNNGLMSNPVERWVETLKPHGRRLGTVCALFAANIYERLDTIAMNTGSNTLKRRYVDTMTFDAPGSKEREVPIGQCYTLALLAVSAPTTVSIRSGGRLMYIKTFAAADTVGPDAMISGGSGTPFTVISSAAVEVTMHLDITQRDNPVPGNSGERGPSGIHTNAMELAIEQHFPGMLDSPPPIDTPGGTIHGASD